MFRLLFLPFRIARRILWMIVWYSVYFLLKRPKLFIFATMLLLAGVIYVGWEVFQNRALMIAKPSATQMVEGKNIPTVSGKIEDGNSAFSANIIEMMQPFEKQAYSKHFYYAMQDKKPGEEYRWQVVPTIYGAITPTESFTSSSGVPCRQFSELISVRGVNQSIRGISCKRKEGGWCKLRPNSVPICGMKGPGGMKLWMHEKKLRLQNLF